MNASRWLQRHARAIGVCCHDLAMVASAWLAAFWLRFNLEWIPEPFWHNAVELLPSLLLIHALVLGYFGLYRGLWQFASLLDFSRIVQAVAVATVLSALWVYWQTQMVQVPRSAFIIHAALLVLLLGTPRYLTRWLSERRQRAVEERTTRVLVVGTGYAGGMLVRDLLHHAGPYRPVAIVDEGRRVGSELHGVRIVAGVDDISAAVARFGVDEIFIAVPEAPSPLLRRIVDNCEASGVPFRMLPRWSDLLAGRIVNELRHVSIEDLLGREPVTLDWGAIRGFIAQRRVLVTGGGGSIGSELCRQVASLNPLALTVIDHSEYALYQIDRDLRERFPKLNLQVFLVDVCDRAGLEQVMSRQRPEVIFHAAAYKHVPLLEHQLRAALRNNLFGTANVIRTADRYGCRHMVVISTDKAVNPISGMGYSKYFAEAFCRYYAPQARARLVIVRFGNVLDSAGSVVPLFREQIRRGGPLTITHPDIKRYFMTISEACQLIMQAGAVGKSGEVYVLDMGEPVSIRYLAEQMVRLSGKRPGRDIAICYTGLRPGEKLDEELFHGDEQLQVTPYPKLLLARRRRTLDGAAFELQLTALTAACEAGDEEKIGSLIAQWMAREEGRGVGLTQA